MKTTIHTKKYWILVGTRPEVIKQVPLYLELLKRFGKDQVALIGTGQHKELLKQALDHFGIEPDINLNIMTQDQSLVSSSAAVLEGIGQLLRECSEKPEWVIVQGDTTTAAMAAWAAFQSGVKVAHNEAGLRSYNLKHPFPEEANRKLIGTIADLHLAPTELARNALLKEGVSAQQVFITGNTGIDALRWTLEQTEPESICRLISQLQKDALTPVLVTAHRRENRSSMESWFKTLREFLNAHSDLALVCPMHPNQAAEEAARRFLGDLPRAHIRPAMNYAETCHLLKHCAFVVTDSGGIQEEASTLGVPVVVCRQTTERMEAVHEGIALLAGNEPEKIYQGMLWAVGLSSTASRIKTVTVKTSFSRNIFGNGFSATTIADLLSSQWPSANHKNQFPKNSGPADGFAVSSLIQ